MIARHQPVFRRRLARDALLFGGLAVGIAQGLGISPTIDGLIYWRAHLDALYPPGGWTSGEPAYVYPPPMAQLLAPIHLLGYGIYQTLWTTMLFGCLWYCAGIWSWLFIVLGMIRLAVPGAPDEFSVVLGYAMTGNVQLLLAAAIVASFRNSATWVAPLLTKPTMGIGLLWYPLRRQWSA